ncbi:MAG: hypothetical protein Q9224_005731 [Gallowayella concinna]
MLLKRIPKRQITNFIWDHGCFFDSATIRCLLESQPSLTSLSQDRSSYEAFNLERPVTGFQALNLRSLGHEDLSCLWDLLSKHKSSLKHLTIGAETTVIESYHWSERESSSASSELYDEALEELMENFGDFDDEDCQGGASPLNLTTFKLVGLNAGPLIQGCLCMLEFTELTSLSLESCRGLESLFATLRNADGKQGVPTQSLKCLKSFHLRHDSTYQPVNIRAQLMEFLVSLPPLTNLSILLEANERPQDLRDQNFDKVLLTHGKSLKTLLWEERSGTPHARSYDIHATYPSPKGLVEIAHHCRNLQELGVPLDWNIFIAGLTFGEYERARLALGSLHSLRTLSIRTMPRLESDEKMSLGDRGFECFVSGAITALISGWSINDMHLETLALGALTYRDVRNGLGLIHIHERNLYTMLRPRIYDVDRRYVFEGRPKPIANLREIGTYEKTEAAGRCVEVLRPYWLG